MLDSKKPIVKQFQYITAGEALKEWFLNFLRKDKVLLRKNVGVGDVARFAYVNGRTWTKEFTVVPYIRKVKG